MLRDRPCAARTTLEGIAVESAEPVAFLVARCTIYVAGRAVITPYWRRGVYKSKGCNDKQGFSAHFVFGRLKREIDLRTRGIWVLMLLD